MAANTQIPIWFFHLNSRCFDNRFSTFLLCRFLLDIIRKDCAKQPSIPILVCQPKLLEFNVHLPTQRVSSSSLMSSLKQWAGEFAAHQLQKLHDLCGPLTDWPHGSNKAQRFSIETKEKRAKTSPCLSGARWCPSSSFLTALFWCCFVLQNF